MVLCYAAPLTQEIHLHGRAGLLLRWVRAAEWGVCFTTIARGRIAEGIASVVPLVAQGLIATGTTARWSKKSMRPVLRYAAFVALLSLPLAHGQDVQVDKGKHAAEIRYALEND